ncbi:metallo-endopeptidase [Metarhizium guizhouense ARSEF 977]|uniref:deuterolysin n=1 Tax=Metarhizium guizhouense (strain ARSEF 977) TaxID=1276136 RepID=A0A0B4HWG6_METGA|nr:metallo-endopeptidase [Metarhizium guizhouense ARSEF 977]
MRQVLLFAAWAWANAEACASCQGKAWTRRSGNDDNNNNAISLNSGGIFEQFSCGTVPASHADMGKRASVKDDCSQKDVIETALKTCVQYAEAGAKEANNKENPLFEFFFKKENDAQRGQVAEQLQAIANECRATQGGAISVTCTDGTIEKCTGPDGRDYTAWANQKLGSTPGSIVQLCKPFFGSLGSGCGQLDRPGVLVHEFSHALVGTDDFKDSGGYGLGVVLKLPASDNLKHADTWALFAQAASLGCTTEQLKQAPQGTGPTPEQGTQPLPGQGTQPPPEQGTQPPPWQVTRPPPDQGTRPPPDQGTRPPPWQVTRPPPWKIVGDWINSGARDRIISGA